MQENFDLIKGCQKGDRKAQEALYKDYYRAMATICMRYMRNEEDAVEVLNNGFLKVFKNIDRYDATKGALYTWIRTIVVNSCLDFIRSKHGSENHAELTDATEAHIPAEAVSQMKTNELLQLVRRLAPATQAVFNLYVIEGYNHKEIGQLLGISDGTSKWHLSAARKTLQQMLKTMNIHG